MQLKIYWLYITHIKKNPRIYVFLSTLFVMGIMAGCFATTRLYSGQLSELNNYVQGFMNIFDIQKLDNWYLFKVSLCREFKDVLILWALGVSIIGIPFIFVTVIIRGFVMGVSISIIFMCLGKEGIVVVLALVLFKELFLTPVLLSMAANGIMFSMNIIKSCSGKKKILENIKLELLRYSLFAGIQLIIVIIPVVLEAIIIPVFIKF